MSYRSRDDRQPASYMRSARPIRTHGWGERDDGFYDDRRSSSRSRDRRYSPPPRRRTSPHVSSTTSSRDQATDDRSDRRHYEDYHPRNRSYALDSSHRDPSLSPDRGKRVYRDRDRSAYKPAGFDGRSRSRSQSPRRSSRIDRPRKHAAPPNKEIMMEGLATDMTEDDITFELKQHYRVEGLTDVRVIRDRQSKQSRQFGFLRFSSLSDAQLFMEQHHPLLYLHGNPNLVRDSPTKVRLVYSRERGGVHEDGVEGEWTCKICTITNYSSRPRCFRCQAYRADTLSRGAPKAANNGDNDVATDNTPTQFLLFRGLETSVTEELLVKGVAKLYKPSAADSSSQQPNRRGVKVASTTGDANLGAKEGTLLRVLLVRDCRTNESWRFGFAEFATVVDAMAALTRYNSFEKFTIASKAVLVSYVHSGVFVPVSDRADVDQRSAFSLSGDTSMKIAYWDDEAYVSELKLCGERFESGTDKPSRENLLIKGPDGKELSKPKKRKVESTTMDISTAKKAAPSYLQRWSHQHAELHGLESKHLQGETQGTSKSDERASSEISPAPPTQSYTDPDRHCCYLCARQFKSAAAANKHERLSELHQKNIQSEDLIFKARTKLQKHGLTTQQEPQTTEYRDRAKERRKAFGVINKKGQQVQPSKASSTKPGSTLSLGGDKDNGGNATDAIASKGAVLLGKMGYVAGAGLGASGTGSKAPIAQDVYIAGVGLGAEGGKVGDALEEAERNTKGDYGDFLAKTREGARERYERLN